MSHTLPDLPYAYDALEPHIDARTMEIHHTKHHNGYVTKLNAALESHADLQAKSLEDLMGDLNGRRGRINGMEVKGNTQIIRAQVPMAEMLTYQNDLVSMTQGRASFGMDFDHYDYVPQQNAEKIIAAAKAEGAGAEEEEE